MRPTCCQCCNCWNLKCPRCIPCEQANWNLLAPCAKQVSEMMECDGGTGSQQQQQQQRSDGLRVSLVKLSSCGVLSGGVVVSLQSSGSSIIACEALGSVTAMRVLTTAAGRVQLLPVGADRSGLMAMDVVVPPQAAGQQQAAAAATEVPAGTTADYAPNSSSPTTAAGVMPTSHQPLLVATHPQGLLLLQRDLAAEQQHQQLAREAAVWLWEAGGRATGMLAWHQQQQELLAAAVQPWLGAGEAAPWAAAGVQGRPHHQRWQAAAAGPAAQRAALVAVAAGAASGAAAGVLNPGAAEAPRLIPSAACAPTAGISVMCAAQLGLHAKPLGVADGISTSGVSTADPVWCFSPSGAVSVVQLLKADQAQVLLQLQKQLLHQHGQQSSQQRSVLQLQPGAWDGQRLQQLHKLGPSAFHRNYRRARSARAAVNLDHQEDAEDELPFNCVDGDMLLAADDMAGSTPLDSPQQQARLLQHRLTQAIF